VSVPVSINCNSCAALEVTSQFDIRRTLAAVVIASRVDYCNASAAVIRWLQMVLNATASLVVDAGKYEHITPVLRDVLH